MLPGSTTFGEIGLTPFHSILLPYRLASVGKTSPHPTQIIWTWIFLNIVLYFQTNLPLYKHSSRGGNTAEKDRQGIQCPDLNIKEFLLELTKTKKQLIKNLLKSINLIKTFLKLGNLARKWKLQDVQQEREGIYLK